MALSELNIVKSASPHAKNYVFCILLPIEVVLEFANIDDERGRG